MTRTAHRAPAHIVVVGHHDTETSTIGGALARRLQRPFLDRTTAPATTRSNPTKQSSAAAADAALAWYDETIQTNNDTVIAAPSVLLDQGTPPADPSNTWTVWLDDPTSNLITTGGDVARRRSNARQLCDTRVDTGDHDTGDHDIDRIVEQIAQQWEHVERNQRTEHHHLR